MQQGGNSEEFLESVKVDLFPDKVYVFTPKGDIRRLPRGATCVDFAYDVHTDVGNRCVAAKVDRRLVPLRTPLRNGQTVEVITARGATPNPSWVEFRRHGEGARRHPSLPQEPQAQRGGRARQAAAEPGARGVLDDAAQAAGRRDRLASSTSSASRARTSSIEKIGLGERVAPLVARRCCCPAPKRTATTPAGPLAIAGTEGLVVTYARCCFPIPNDPILANLSSGRGVVIHREACGNLASFRKQPDKWISVTWQADIDRLFHVEIKVEVTNQTGVLAQVAAAIASTQTNIERVSVVERDSDSSTLDLRAGRQGSATAGARDPLGARHAGGAARDPHARVRLTLPFFVRSADSPAAPAGTIVASETT